LWKLNGSVLQITYFEWSPPTNILSDAYSDILSGILSNILHPEEVPYYHRA
jgi:hypothetical protein